MEQSVDLGMEQHGTENGSEHGTRAWNRVWTGNATGQEQLRHTPWSTWIAALPKAGRALPGKDVPNHLSIFLLSFAAAPPRLVRSLAVPRAALSSQPGSAQLQQGGTKDSQMTLPEADLSRGVGGSPARRSASNNHMHPPSMKRLYALIPDGK